MELAWILYKSALFLMLTGLCYLMYKTIATARLIPAMPKILQSPEIDVTTVLSLKQIRDEAVGVHSRFGYIQLGVTLVFLVAVESKRLWFGSLTHDWFFQIHIWFAVLYFLSLAAMVIWFNGIRFRRHAWIGYACLSFFIPAAGIGAPMIWRMHAF